MKTPEKLPLGKYRIVEVEGPHGYFNDRQYNVVFELTSDRVYQVSGGSADGMDDYVITESYYNHETLGQIKIRKIGNVLTGYENGQFVYESDNLANATYEIHAQGDIPTPDNQGTLWYADGDLIATVTTAEDGQVDEVQFGPTRTSATYDFLKVITMARRQSHHHCRWVPTQFLKCRLLTALSTPTTPTPWCLTGITSTTIWPLRRLS